MMSTNLSRTDSYLSTMIREKLHSNEEKLRFHMAWLFEGIDFQNENVLDIGGGSGLNSFYAVFMGAKNVVCLEPETAGSTSGVIDKFHRVQKHFAFDNIELRPETIQSFEADDETFDIVLLYNSINHLDEAACIDLLRNPESRAVYRGLLSKIGDLSNKGAKIIICDCSNHNFFAFIKVRNPFAPRIEWHKHQAPEVWVELLKEVGFVNPKVRWSSSSTLRNWGRLLLGNRFSAYFLRSHFCLTMEKPLT